MAIHYNTRIPTNGLVLALDAGNTKSYSGTGSTAYDLSGNGYTHTTTNSTAAALVDGVTCFDCTGTKNLLESGTPTYTFNGTYTLIAWAWATPDASVATWRTLWRTSGTHPILIQNDTNDIGGFYGAFRSYGLNLATIGAESAWTMYTVTATGGSSSIYINDGKITGNSIAYSENGTTHQRIGSYTTTQPFGYVSYASIYDRVLSLSEINGIFNATRGRHGK